MTQKVQGRISLHPRGFGFLNVEAPEGDTSAFITPPDLNLFLDGDIVTATMAPAEPGRFTATALALVERERSELFGSVVFHGKKPFLKVDRLVSNTDWAFEDGSAAELREGDYAVALIHGNRVTRPRRVEATADLAIERCVARHGIRADHPPEVIEAARKAVLAVRAGERKDLRAVPTVTIDAASTRDIDDALSVLPAGSDGALRALVSIADVDAFVQAGSRIDEEARLRGTSVYLAGRVLPMLPEILSSEAASLVEGQDRLALTAELRIDAEGEVRSVDVYASRIKSHARLTYEAVDEFFETGASDGIPEAVRPTIRWLRTAAARLGAVRAARGGVDLAREEALIALDPRTGEPLGVEARADTEAHRVVERLMVAANEAVARWLFDRGLPGLFRVHDEPDEDRVQKLAEFAHNFGIEAGFGPKLTPRGLAAFEAQWKGTAIDPAMRSVLSKTLGPARYTVTPSSHFGLAAPLYLHFTSPIRRYADLAVHRVVKRYLNGDRSFVAGDPTYEAVAVHVNRAAYRATKAETERHRMLVARLFASRVGEVVTGNIVAVQPFGVVVQLTGMGATGTVALDVLPDGPYRVDLAAQRLTGPSRTFAVGDPIRTKIAATNEELGRIELSLA